MNMARFPVPLAFAVLILVASLASAHPKAYMGGSDVVVVARCDSDDLGFGGVCYAAGHVTSDLTGDPSFSVIDAMGSVGLFACQDVDDDGRIQVGSLVRGEARAGCGEPGEWSQIGCGAVVDSTFPDPSLDPTVDVWVFVDGLLQGASAGSCGGFGSLGVVTHS